MSNAERQKSYRIRQIGKGLCIAGCGRKSEMGCGLCFSCGKKYNARALAYYVRNRLKKIRK